MGEPDKRRDLPSPEVQLFARLRLQRVVFGAFAIVLVCLFALGLSAYRKMQRETVNAQADAQNAQLTANQARAQADRLERQLQDVRENIIETEGRLALGKCRLAIHEIRDGNVSRARALLEEARKLGPPPWWPLVDRLTDDATVRFEGGATKSPVIAGAVSADRKVVAVARETPDGIVVETFSAGDGKLLMTYPPVAGTRAVEGNVRLLLSRDGTGWYLPLAGRAYRGGGGIVVPVARAVGDDPPDEGLPRGVAAGSDLSVVFEALGANGLVERREGPGQTWTSRRIVLDLLSQQVDAVCIVGDRPVVATPTGIFEVGTDGRTGLLFEIDDAPERVALHRGTGAVFAAMLRGRVLELVAVKTGEQPHLETFRHEMPDEPVEDLRFMGDDTLVWVGRSGRIFTISFDSTREWTLGGYTLTFIERHPQGLVFGNRKGELSVRAQDEFRKVGIPMAALPPKFGLESMAHGFVFQAPTGERFVLQDGRVRALGVVTDVALSPLGAAFSDGALTLPGGQLAHEQGVLLGAFADGSVLLFAHSQKLKHVSARGVTEFLLPGERAPDATAIAASANVAGLRVADSVFVTDLASDLEQVASRVEVAPDLIALGAEGTHLAIAYGATVVVHGLQDGAALTVRLSLAPRKIALLFKGSVLVAIEAGELVFYEVASARELLRAGDAVTDLAASGSASLNLVNGGWLHTLDLRPRS